MFFTVVMATRRKDQPVYPAFAFYQVYQGGGDFLRHGLGIGGIPWNARVKVERHNARASLGQRRACRNLFARHGQHAAQRREAVHERGQQGWLEEQQGQNVPPADGQALAAGIQRQCLRNLAETLGFFSAFSLRNPVQRGETAQRGAGPHKRLLTISGLADGLGRIGVLSCTKTGRTKNTCKIAHCGHLQQVFKIDGDVQRLFHFLNDERKTAGTQGQVVTQIQIGPHVFHRTAAGAGQHVQNPAQGRC